MCFQCSLLRFVGAFQAIFIPTSLDRQNPRLSRMSLPLSLSLSSFLVVFCFLLPNWVLSFLELGYSNVRVVTLFLGCRNGFGPRSVSGYRAMPVPMALGSRGAKWDFLSNQCEGRLKKGKKMKNKKRKRKKGGKRRGKEWNIEENFRHLLLGNPFVFCCVRAWSDFSFFVIAAKEKTEGEGERTRQSIRTRPRTASWIFFCCFQIF